MDRKLRYKEIQEYADQLGPFLSICRQAELFRGDPAVIVECNARALGMILPEVARILRAWLAQLEDLKLDLPYRERALRAERQLRADKKAYRRAGDAGA